MVISDHNADLITPYHSIVIANHPLAPGHCCKVFMLLLQHQIVLSSMFYLGGEGSGHTYVEFSHPAKI